MKMSDFFSAKAVGVSYTEVASNQIPYLGTGLFPAQKKMGLDLKWIKGHAGLPVSLAPSAFDVKSSFRDRVGVEVSETEMPFFRESMLVSEADEQEIMRVQDSADPYAIQVLERIFDDAHTLVEGAKVVPERMIMQLLAPIGGVIGINISSGGTNYTYDYDPSGTWRADHYTKIVTPADQWTTSATCDPIRDLETAMDKQEELSGSRPEIILMSKGTFNLIKNSEKVQKSVLALNLSGVVNYTTSRIMDYLQEELRATIIVYNKQFKDEAGRVKKFYPDNIVMLLPAGALGKTWFGTTPEERTLMSSDIADVSIVETGVAVSVTYTSDPVNTKTTVSEIVLPSFERLHECYGLEVADA